MVAPTRTTRPGNAAKRPGLVDRTEKRKRRSQEEMQRDREAKQAEKEQQLEKKQGGIDRIAALENGMAAADDNQGGQRHNHNLRRTASFSVIPPTLDEDERYLDNHDLTQALPSVEEEDAESDTTELAPPKKKSRVPSSRASVDERRAIPERKDAEAGRGDAGLPKKRPQPRVRDEINAARAQKKIVEGDQRQEVSRCLHVSTLD
jgi:hypothetical protein